MKKLIKDIEELKCKHVDPKDMDSYIFLGGYGTAKSDIIYFIKSYQQELDAPNDTGFWWKKLGNRIDCVYLIKQETRYYYWSGTQYDGDIKRYTDEDIGYKWIKAIVPE